jgi:hypothetical protein
MLTKDTTTLYATDRDVFPFLVDDTNPIEARRLADGSPDLYFRGFYCCGVADRRNRVRTVSGLSLGELQRATAYILAVQLLRTTCHLSWMLVTAWSCEVSVPVSRSGDHYRTVIWRHCARPFTPRSHFRNSLGRTVAVPDRNRVRIHRSLRSASAIGPARLRPPCGRAGQCSRSRISS